VELLKDKIKPEEPSTAVKTDIEHPTDNLNVINDNIQYSINPSEPDRMISVKHMNSRSRSKYRMLDQDTKRSAIEMAMTHPQGLHSGLK